MSNKLNSRSEPVKSTLALLKRRPHWFVFPIQALAKYPPILSDNLDSGNSNDPEQVKAWAKQYPGCNFGLALKKSHAIAPDIDNKPPKVGDVTWAALRSKHADEIGDAGVDDTFTVRTPSGGFHYYFDETAVVRYKFALGVNGFGLNVDSSNYVVLPGGRTADGVYRVINKSPIRPAPDWFAEYLRPSNDPPPEKSDKDDQIPVVDLDQEHNIRQAHWYLTHDAPPSIEGKDGGGTLVRIVAPHLKDLAISEDLAVEMIARLYNVPKGDGRHPYCDPLWSTGDCDDADNLDKKVHNGYKYCKLNAPGSGTTEASFGDDEEEFR